MNPDLDDWDYCVATLPKVSRTFALNISVLRGQLHRSILTAYLFCRIVDTVEDAAELEARNKIDLLLDFSRLIKDSQYRKTSLEDWIEKCRVVDGSVNDLELLSSTARVFRVFDTLPEVYQNQIIPSVSEMARGMAYFQTKFESEGVTCLENQNELEEYCYFVAGLVGEMLCNLFLVEMPSIDEESKTILKSTAVSFGLGLQMTNISKDMVVDRSRGWSYIPKSFITDNGMTLEEFSSGESLDRCLVILEKLLHKTTGHLHDALKFTLAIPRRHYSIRLFCILPLWMAMETVAVLHNNRALLSSDDPVKISRQTVRRIMRRSPLICGSNFFLKQSFFNILQADELKNPPEFDLEHLKKRLNQISLDTLTDNSLTV